MSLYSNIRGTTSDKFSIGAKNKLLTLVGTTTSDGSILLQSRDSTTFTATSTLFFSIYVVGQGTANTAAYEIKGCYVAQTKALQGYVVNTFVDTNNFTKPEVVFDANGIFSISCTGLVGETISWTAIIDIIAV